MKIEKRNFIVQIFCLRAKRAKLSIICRCASVKRPFAKGRKVSFFDDLAMLCLPAGAIELCGKKINFLFKSLSFLALFGSKLLLVLLLINCVGFVVGVISQKFDTQINLLLVKDSIKNEFVLNLRTLCQFTLFCKWPHCCTC